jgi:CspA family cold shock protein
LKGTVKWYNPRKGYGFIQGEDGKDVFVHSSALTMGADISEKDQVEYQIEESERGQRATKVKILKYA